MADPTHLRVLRKLREIARAGEVCPPRRELATMLQIEEGTLGTAFRRLKFDNRIQVLRRGNRYMIVLIGENLQTADPTPVCTIVVRPRIAEMVGKAADIFGVTAKDIVQRSQFPEHVRARQAVSYVAASRGWPVTIIARSLRRDHSTILYSRRKAERLLSSDQSFAFNLRALDEAVPASFEKVVA